MTITFRATDSSATATGAPTRRSRGSPRRPRRARPRARAPWRGARGRRCRVHRPGRAVGSWHRTGHSEGGKRLRWTSGRLKLLYKGCFPGWKGFRSVQRPSKTWHLEVAGSDSVHVSSCNMYLRWPRVLCINMVFVYCWRDWTTCPDVFHVADACKAAFCLCSIRISFDAKGRCATLVSRQWLF